ncbi:MAG TPA: single-stranded DNA-binding protein [Flavobacteriaceae bacterium]|nr:single-stranded DNA-binding protein [Flavobacteriaceae bacterium]
MSGTLNKVMLIGRTGDDVKMHYFEGGGSIGRFPLATNETYTNRTTNQRVTNTEWHNIVVRNKAAEICEKYLKKGDMVYIEGRLRTRKWTDDKGVDRYSTEVQCNEFRFLTPKSESGSDRMEGANPMQNNDPIATTQSSGTTESTDVNEGTEDDSSDLPF